MLVNSNVILNDAKKKGYAVAAYNINNLEWTKYILEACNKDKSPVILAVTPKSISYFGGVNVVCDIVKSLMKDLNIKVPVVLHLDHGNSVEICKEAIDAGFTSVMIDASNETIEENILKTMEVVKYAKQKGVSVEAEVNTQNDSISNNVNHKEYINIDKIKEFVLQTDINSFAPLIGNKHGIYNEEPVLDFKLLGLICKMTSVPLVLHGASGLNENKIRTAIFCGITKININTDLQIAWSNALKEYLEQNKNVYDPRKIISSGESALKKIIHEKNKLFGSKNRAI